MGGMPVRIKSISISRSFVLALFAATLLAAPALLGGCPRQGAGTQRQEPTLTVYVHKTGQKLRMKMEQYLQGVIAGEMEPEWPREALAAQAIVARTFTMERLAQGGVRELHGTDACTEPTHFQAYNPAEVNANVRAAVKATRGQVITYRGQLVRAWYHSASGGTTATPAEGLDWRSGSLPYLAAVKDVTIPQNTMRWQASFTADEIRNAVGAMGGAGAEISQVKSLRVGRRGPSGRAETLLVNGQQSVSAVKLRARLGTTRMKSTLLDSVKVQGDRVVMSGRGWGHGVGMSQWGAFALAQRGRKAPDIIRQYYRGVNITRQWA